TLFPYTTLFRSRPHGHRSSPKKLSPCGWGQQERTTTNAPICRTPGRHGPTTHSPRTRRRHRPRRRTVRHATVQGIMATVPRRVHIVWPRPTANHRQTIGPQKHEKDPRNPRATKALEPQGSFVMLVVVSVATAAAPRHPPTRPIRIIALTGTFDGRSLTEPVNATITPHRHDKAPFRPRSRRRGVRRHQQARHSPFPGHAAGRPSRRQPRQQSG